VTELARVAELARATDLNGAWLACRGDRELTKVFAEPDFDDATWHAIEVPGHWRSSTAFADDEEFSESADLAESDGPVLYRHRFDRERLRWGRRAWLEFDGIFYFGDVWLDGDYLGTTEGYFTPHAFEVTEQFLTEEHHILAVEVASPPQPDRTAKRTITGVFGHWDAMDSSWNPGGIWRAVRVRETGPVRIARTRVLCVAATASSARVRVDLTVDAGAFPPAATAVVTEVFADNGGVLGRAERELSPASGSTELRIEVDIDDPPLWWPASMGEQTMVEVVTRVLIEPSVVGGEESDRSTARLGLRSVTVDDWIFSVNGQRLFIRGANHAPTRIALADAAVDEFRRDVQLALDANLNLLRVHAHVTRPEFYEAADELGLLIWQDFPLQWGYGRSARRGAMTQARALVDRLGQHPSIAMWCAHNEPLAVDLTADAITPKVGARLAASMFLPSWNKSVLDRGVAHVIRGADPSRFVDVHSGVLPGPASLGTDSHFYFGWYHGQLDQLPAVMRAFPRLARFVSEFGAQSVPNTDDFCDPERWPDLDWERLATHHCLQLRLLDARVPSEHHASFASWRDATQRYQAALLQLQIEDLRRLKYRPAGGYCLFSFADAHAAISWSILDHERVPKLAYAAVAAASRPLLALVDHRTGDVHVVNDTRRSFRGATVTVDVDGASTAFVGDVAEDSLAWVGRVEVGNARTVTTTLDVGGDHHVVHHAFVPGATQVSNPTLGSKPIRTQN
jgi:beta-mannosidase